MVAPVSVKAGENLYVMQINMSSPYFLTKSEPIIRENAKKLFYKYSPETRREIQAIRQNINVHADACSAKFFGLKIANELAKQQMTDLLKQADHDMKQIDVTLGAGAVFIKMSSTALTTGNLFDQMVGQIREQIHEVVLKRIEKTIERQKGGQLSDKTKKALLSMLDKLKAINVVEDETIEARIETMKTMIEANEIVTLRDEILEIFESAGETRYSSLPIGDFSPETQDVADDAERQQIEGSVPVKKEPKEGRVKVNTTGSRAAKRLEVEGV